jgi:hypothetical protein
MTKTNKIILIILAILLIGGFYLLNRNSDKPYNKVVLSKENHITNLTNTVFLDTIVNVGLSELKQSNVFLLILPLTQKQIDQFGDNGELKAQIVGKEGNYIIFVSDISRSESITILSHELIHLTQYQSGRLVLTSKGVIWENELVDNNLSYDKRPWEIEAFSKQINLSDKIEKVLKIKNKK